MVTMRLDHWQSHSLATRLSANVHDDAGQTAQAFAATLEDEFW
jgi:hypothetical protein